MEHRRCRSVVPLARHLNCQAIWLLCAVGLSTIVIAPARAADLRAADLLAEALTAAKEMGGASDENGFLLCTIADLQATIGDVAGARRTAEAISPAAKRNLAYSMIASARAKAGDMDGAKALLEVVTGDDGKAGIIGELARAQALNGDVAGAKATAQGIKNPLSKALVDIDIAAAQAAVKDVTGALATAAGVADVEDFKVEAYVKVAEAQLQAGDAAGARKTMDLAKATAEKLSDRIAPLFGPLAAAQIKVGDIAGAHATAARVDEDARSLIYTRIAAAQLEVGDMEGAKTTAKRFTAPHDKMDFFLRLAEAQAKGHDAAAARQSVDAAKGAAAAISTSLTKAFAYERIATMQATTGSAAEAVKWARAQEEPLLRARALCGIVRALLLAESSKRP